MYEGGFRDTSIAIDLSVTRKETFKHLRGDCDKLPEADGLNLATIETCCVGVERRSFLRNCQKREQEHVVKWHIHAQSPGLHVVLSRCIALIVIVRKIATKLFGFSCGNDYCHTFIGFQRESKKEDGERTSLDFVEFGTVLLCLVWKFINNVLRAFQCLVSNLACRSWDILCHSPNDDTTYRRHNAGPDVEKRLARTEFKKAKKCSCTHSDGRECDKSRCVSIRRQLRRTSVVYDTRPAAKEATGRFESLVRSRNSLEVKTAKDFSTQAEIHTIHPHDINTDVNNSNDIELSLMEAPLSHNDFNNPDIHNNPITYDLIGSPIILSASKREFHLGNRSRNISWTATTESDVTETTYSSNGGLSLPHGMCLRSGRCYSPKGESSESDDIHSSDRLANKSLLRVMTNAGLSHQQLDTLLASDISIEYFLLTVQQVTPGTISDDSEEDLSLFSILKCLDSSPPPRPAELAGADAGFASRYFTRSLANQMRCQSQSLHGSVRSTDLQCYSHNHALNQDIKDDSASSAQLLSSADPTFEENVTPQKNSSRTLPYNPSPLNNLNKTLPSNVAYNLTEYIAAEASPSDLHQHANNTNLINMSDQDCFEHPDQEAGETLTNKGSHLYNDSCEGRDSFPEEFPNLWEALDYITQSGELDSLANSDRMVGGKVGSLSFVSDPDPFPQDYWGTWGLQAELCDISRTSLLRQSDLFQYGSDYSGLSFPDEIGSNSPFETVAPQPLEQKHRSISPSGRGIKRSAPGDDDATVTSLNMKSEKKLRLSNDNIFMPTEPTETSYSRNLARLVSVLAGNRTGRSTPTLSASKNTALLAKLSQFTAGNSVSFAEVLPNSINAESRAKLLPSSRNSGRFTKVLPGSRNSGRPTNVSPSSRKSGRFTKVLPGSRNSGHYTKVLPASRKSARSAKVSPPSRKSARLAKLLPASRNSGRLVIATNTRRNSTRADKTSAAVRTSGRLTRESLSVIKSGRLTKGIHATRASARLGKQPHGDIK